MRRNKQKRTKRRITWALILGSMLIAYQCFSQETNETFSALIKQDVFVQPDEVLTSELLGLQDDARFKSYDLTPIELRGKISAVENENISIEWLEIYNSQNNRLVRLPTALTSVEKKDLIAQDAVVSVNGSKNQLSTLLPILYGTSPTTEDVIKTKEAEAFVAPTGSGQTAGLEKSPYSAEAIEVNESDTISVSTEKCDNRVDMTTLKVYPQSAVLHLTNGVETSRDSCQDSGLPMDILYSYIQCEPKVDLAENVVYAMRRPYYIDNGEQKYLGDCGKDPERFFAINESFSCTPLIDMRAKTVKEQSSLYYQDDTGRSIVISECQPRDANRTFDLTTTYDTCSYRLESDKGIAYQQQKIIYEKDGVIITVSNCQDSDLTYAVESEFCQYGEDWKANTITTFARSKINTVQGLFYLTDCQPMASTEIVETQSGCDTLHTDYFEAKYSVGFSRYYHVQNGKKIYLTECGQANITYPHQFKIEDWEADFSRHQAVAKMSVYIEMPSGLKQIRPPAVYSDSLRVPLAKQGERVVGTKEYVYPNDCDEYEKVQTEITYLLPNGKTVIELVDIPDPVFSKSYCVTMTEEVSIWGCNESFCGKHACQSYQGSLIFVRQKVVNGRTNIKTCTPWKLEKTALTLSTSVGSFAALCSGPVCAGYYYRADQASCNNNVFDLLNRPCS